MEPGLSFDPSSFKGFEQAGWERHAARYDELLGSVTRHAMGPLLDAAAVRSGTTLLETCCGPGYGSAAALVRGARPIGVDIALAMVAEARARHPGAAFRQGDAEHLAFEAGTFDAVICPFGVNHLPDPDAAMREAFRVLRPGGRFAFTMWCAPGRSKFHQLVLEAIRNHGTLDVPLPPAPPIFRFSEPGACRAGLEAAGFRTATVMEIPLTFRTRDPREVLALACSAVRLEMTIALQAPEARERIHGAIIEGAEAFAVGDRIELPMPALVASGEKP